MDRLHNEGMVDRICKLCNQEVETHDHLFFLCGFAAQVWRTIANRSRTYWPPLHWHQLLQWTAQRYKNRRSISNLIGPSILATTVYHLWQERNRRIFQNRFQEAINISGDIYHHIRDNLANHPNRVDLPAQVRTVWNIGAE